MSDTAQIRREYERRDADAALLERYAPTRPEMQFARYQRMLRLLKMLEGCGALPLSGRTVLDVGAGAGGGLRSLMEFGAEPHNLFGVDLSRTRLNTAKTLSPHLGWCEAGGAHLPFPNACFDVVMQWTVLSSVVLEQARVAIASEMMRVLHPEGHIVWYDILSTDRSDVLAGLPLAAVRALFPGYDVDARRVTLHWGIARRLVSTSWELAGLLERLSVFNTHLLAIITPAGTSETSSSSRSIPLQGPVLE